MNEQYLEAVKTIKTAILKSQSRAAKFSNKEMLFIKKRKPRTKKEEE